MLTQVELLKKYRVLVKGHLGQHLLVDANISRKIVQLAALQPGDTVLEIGPGLGALTWLLLQPPVRVIAIEKDKRFAEALQEEWRERSPESGLTGTLEVIHEDFLDWNLEAFLSGKNPVKVVSNLPYYITAPILFRLVENRAYIQSAVLMMQKEVARRLVAKPGTEDYGRLSLGIQYAAEIQETFDVSPGCFTPQPEVGSTVVRLNFKPSCFQNPGQEKKFFDLVKLAFSQRRKTLAALLVQAKWVPGKALARKLLESCALAVDVRGEKMTLNDFINLTENLRTCN